MCGFLGQYNYKEGTNSQFRLLLEMGYHRGPDQTDIWQNDWIKLGFNRLAILELSDAGAQPMLSPNQHFVLVFNGEIYNHVELREQLPTHNYRGHSDTETIAFALECWGIHTTVKALDGMFALGIYDIQGQEVYLARDFAGIKPLFFGHKENSLVFASQYDQVHQHPLFRFSSINPKVLKLYLQQHFLPAPFGLHENIEQVRPGEIICFSKSGRRKYTRYWELDDKTDYDLSTLEDALPLLEDALSNSVHQQMLADVPLGAFLSGGVDSPLVCSLAKRRNSAIKVFSIGSDSTLHDESERAKAFATSLNLRQSLLQLDAKQMLTHWDEAMCAMHEPLADFSILPTYLISKLARKEVTVALSGDGGDELFFGYERFWSIGKNIRFQHLPRLIRMGLYGLDKFRTSNSNINGAILFDQQCSAHQQQHSRFHKALLTQVIPDLAAIPLPEEWLVYDYPNTKDERVLVGYMRKAEFYGMMQKTLRKVDLASMENSLEVRVPFLQKKMVEIALRIDPFLSYGPNKKKQVLKHLLSRNIPSIKDDGVKRGFSIPLGDWIRQDLKPIFQERLLNGSLDQYGVNRSAVEQMLNDHFTSIDRKWPLFTLYALSK